MALADYDRDWLVRYTYNSNAIEGSTLTLEDTSLVLEGEFVPSDSPARYVFAARGVADGMAYVREYAREGRRLDEELVRRVHEVTALDLQPFARGTFRPYGYLAGITATRVKTADPLEIRDDLRALDRRAGRERRSSAAQDRRLPCDVREHPPVHGRQRADRPPAAQFHAAEARLSSRGDRV